MGNAFNFACCGCDLGFWQSRFLPHHERHLTSLYPLFAYNDVKSGAENNALINAKRALFQCDWLFFLYYWRLFHFLLIPNLDYTKSPRSFLICHAGVMFTMWSCLLLLGGLQFTQVPSLCKPESLYPSPWPHASFQTYPALSGRISDKHHSDS